MTIDVAIRELVAAEVAKAEQRLRVELARVPDPSPYLTIPEAAEYLRCSRQRVDDLLSQGSLRRFKDGRRTLTSRAELDAWLDRYREGR